MELSEAAKQARRDYRRAWRAKNKDKVAAANKRYWEKKGHEAQANPTHKVVSQTGN